MRRLTTDDGIESNPAFSPDGKLIAFSGQYDGNTDVFVMPAEGGIPKRLTWHPGPDIVQGFTPDGTRVLFTSGRAAFTGAYRHLYTVPVARSLEERLPVPTAFQATYSSDGKRLAYSPLPPAFQQWKQYRGGRASRIWIYSTGDHAIVYEQAGYLHLFDPAAGSARKLTIGVTADLRRRVLFRAALVARQPEDRLRRQKPDGRDSSLHHFDLTKRKDETILADVVSRNDLNRVIQWMCSELAIGHHRGGGGDRLETAKTVPGGLLGVDYEVANGRYRFKKVYGGLNWTPANGHGADSWASWASRP